MQVVTDESVLGNFDNAPFEYAGIVSTFLRSDSTFLVRTDGPDGELTDYEIVYTFGVDPLQQYLVEFPDGRLQALGIAWDTRATEEGGQRWFHLYPDERIVHDDPLHWTGPYQNWNHMCAECHSTNFRKNYRSEEDRFETSWTDINVSCEACHGPGSLHVDLANALQEGEQPGPELRQSLTVVFRANDLGTWTMDPETGTARRDSLIDSPLIDVCAPCHSRRTTLSHNVVPGRSFLDTHRPALIDEGLYYPDGQIRDEVYVYGSFLQSKMYAAGVTCSHCHDPHGLELLAEGNALCATCHLASRFDSPDHHFHRPGTDGAQCVSCHMPATTYMVVDPRRDHSMRIPQPELTQKLGVPNACNTCHSDRTSTWAEEYLATWYSPSTDSVRFADTIAGGRKRWPHSVPGLVGLLTDATVSDIGRATAVSLLGSFSATEAQRALEIAARDSDPIVRLASARAAAGRTVDERNRLAIPLLQDPIRAVRTEAARALLSGWATIPDSAAPALEDARDEYLETLRLHADRSESRVALALHFSALGRVADAENELRTALRLNPFDEAAYVNLADLLRQQDRDSAGESILRSGIGRLPESAALRHTLGLLLVRQSDPGAALPELEAAARLAPDVPRYVYTHAIALSSSDRKAEAVEVLEDALATHPYDRDILAALVTLNMELDAPREALRFAEKLRETAPDDPRVIDLVRAVESRVSGPAGSAR